MRSTTMKALFSLLILSLNLGDLLTVVTGDEAINPQITCENDFPKKDIGSSYNIHIVNNLPTNNSNPLLIHCASGDDDLGNHSLRRNCDFNWSCRMNLFLSTLFFCRFRWGERNVAYDVFTDRIADGCFPIDNHVRYRCRWTVREDGFWLEDTKVYDW